MHSESESRSRYLSLALLSRRAINSLRSVAAGHPLDAQLGASLNELLAGAEQEADATFVSHLQGSGAWTTFEDLSTLEELKRETGTHDLQIVVSSVLNDADDVARQNNVKRLISFLTAVEGRALQHYTDAMDSQFA